MSDDRPSILIESVDDGDAGPPHGVREIIPLTETQKAVLIAKIKRKRKMLFTQSERASFSLATSWTTKVFAFTILMGSNFVPIPSYGTDFMSFSNYIHRRKVDAEAAEVVSAEEDGEEPEE